jgi:Nif-specific regulatory protein
VRELENAIERAAVLGESHQILPEDLPERILESVSAADDSGSGYHHSVRLAKKKIILEALRETGANHTAAARLLGVNPTYLSRLIRVLELRDDIARIRR